MDSWFSCMMGTAQSHRVVNNAGTLFLPLSNAKVNWTCGVFQFFDLFLLGKSFWLALWLFGLLGEAIEKSGGRDIRQQLEARRKEEEERVEKEKREALAARKAI